MRVLTANKKKLKKTVRQIFNKCLLNVEKERKRDEKEKWESYERDMEHDYYGTDRYLDTNDLFEDDADYDD